MGRIKQTKLQTLIAQTTQEEPNFPKISKYWLGIWIAIYIVILIVGLLQPKSWYLMAIKLSGVLLCSVYSYVTFPKDRLLQLAMITTFVADCLLAYNNTSNIGLVIFLLAQYIHLYRLQPPERHQNITVIAAATFFLIFINCFARLLPNIYLICGFYALAIICNFYTSWRWYQSNSKNPAAIAAFAGFTLFGCCDLCTVVSFMSLTGVFSSWFYMPANFLAWFFYYPSQILVSNSTKCATIESKEGKC